MKKAAAIFLTFLLFSCSPDPKKDNPVAAYDFAKDNSTLYIAVMDTVSNSLQIKSLDQLTPINQSPIKAVTTDSFEIGLEEMKDGTGLVTLRSTGEIETAKGGQKVRYHICDWC